VEEIARVIVSPLALAVKVGDPFESVVPDADAFSYWREIVILIIAILW
jgi:hypothetical protein